MNWPGRLEALREASAEAWAEAELYERLFMLFIVVFAFNAFTLLLYTVTS